MKILTGSQVNRPGFYLILFMVLVSCLWIGWHDFDPWVPQELVRENIRSTIRWMSQLMVQYFIPGNILVYFAKEIFIRKSFNLVENIAE